MPRLRTTSGELLAYSHKAGSRTLEAASQHRYRGEEMILVMRNPLDRLDAWLRMVKQTVDERGNQWWAAAHRSRRGFDLSVEVERMLQGNNPHWDSQLEQNSEATHAIRLEDSHLWWNRYFPGLPRRENSYQGERLIDEVAGRLSCYWQKDLEVWEQIPEGGSLTLPWY